MHLPSCVCVCLCLAPPLLPAVFHPVECSYCHTESMMGFRYRCQQCHNYQLCQDCFWRGHASGSHSNQHQMKEYTSWVRKGGKGGRRLGEVCLHRTSHCGYFCSASLQHEESEDSVQVTVLPWWCTVCFEKEMSILASSQPSPCFCVSPRNPPLRSYPTPSVSHWAVHPAESLFTPCFLKCQINLST